MIPKYLYQYTSHKVGVEYTDNDTDTGMRLPEDTDTRIIPENFYLFWLLPDVLPIPRFK